MNCGPSAWRCLPPCVLNGAERVEQCGPERTASVPLHGTGLWKTLSETWKTCSTFSEEIGNACRFMCLFIY